MAYSESALCRHFENMEDIIVLLLDYLGNNINERLEIISKNNVISKEKLKQLISSQFHLLMLKWKFSDYEIDLINQGNNIINTTIKLIAK